jgi:hypothetical protein
MLLAAMVIDSFGTAEPCSAEWRHLPNVEARRQGVWCPFFGKTRRRSVSSNTYGG